MRKCLVALIAVCLTASIADAGPLKRLVAHYRAKVAAHAGNGCAAGCAGTTAQAHPAQSLMNPLAGSGGCANGKCQVK